MERNMAVQQNNRPTHQVYKIVCAINDKLQKQSTGMTLKKLNVVNIEKNTTIQRGHETVLLRAPQPTSKKLTKLGNTAERDFPIEIRQ